MNDHQPLYTIGHSNLELASFLETLRRYQVALLIDVRSRPQSSRFPHFSQDALEPAVREAGMRYLALGEELGGRPGDPRAYRNDGLVDYRRRRASREFQSGIDRVLAELEKGSLALMCAEEDPLECHRFLLVCPELSARGLAPQHIRKSKVESQQEAEDRLLREHDFRDVASDSLFASSAEDRNAALEDAYVKQAEKFGFRADPRQLAEF
jgi:uncharacterized protein (DUF488 family)